MADYDTPSQPVYPRTRASHSNAAATARARADPETTPRRAYPIAAGGRTAAAELDALGLPPGDVDEAAGVEGGEGSRAQGGCGAGWGSGRRCWLRRRRGRGWALGGEA